MAFKTCHQVPAREYGQSRGRQVRRTWPAVGLSLTVRPDTLSVMTGDPLEILGQMARNARPPEDPWEIARGIIFSALNEAYFKIYEASNLDGGVVKDQRLVFLYVGGFGEVPCLMFALGGESREVEIAYGTAIPNPPESTRYDGLHTARVKGSLSFEEVTRDAVLDAVNSWVRTERVFGTS